ncbi:MAG: class I SAM-dependent methyltransferase [Saprospiraceae bacterium]|nr:class I SAM-dependent methyltransferase [Saprospiraceae bacterium]
MPSFCKSLPLRRFQLCIMTVERFFELFLKELEENKDWWSYYKFLEDPEKRSFRKAYFCQRLEYVRNHLPKNATQIWDCGCGYGTTALFLGMNGIPVFGNTLEFYYEYIPKRIEYWSEFGDASLFRVSYENLFDMQIEPNMFDAIIIQDTLHHLEPIDNALKILHQALKPGGALIAIEENGNNLIQNAKLFFQRGNKRVITIYDEKLQKPILLGNENIRGISAWKKLFTNAGFQFRPESIEYIRFLLPFQTKKIADTNTLIAKEQSVKRDFYKKYFFFGINFVAQKSA